MARKTGYLASIWNIPPLVFRFQYNPDMISEKRSFKYDAVNEVGRWGFDQTNAASGFFDTLTSLKNDVKEIGALLIGTRPLRANEGEPRTFAIDFRLDANNPGPLDNGDHYGGSIEPDLAVLRSFVNPSIDVFDLTKSLVKWEWPCWQNPPECSLIYVGLNVTCVMTDLNIKFTSFKDDGSPERAEVSVTLKEQAFAFSPIVETVTRTFQSGRALFRAGGGRDLVAATPVLGLFEGQLFGE